MNQNRVHEFTLTLQGDFEDLTEEMLDRLFEAGCDDATVSMTGGRVFLDFDREAASMKDALVDAIRDVRAAGLEVDRVATSELVTKAEIARRLGRSRQRASQWTAEEGSRHDFPAPACRAAEGQSLWRWTEVAHWAYENDLADAEVWQAAEDVDLIDSILAYRNRSRASDETFRRLVASICGDTSGTSSNPADGRS